MAKLPVYPFSLLHSTVHYRQCLHFEVNNTVNGCFEAQVWWLSLSTMVKTKQPALTLEAFSPLETLTLQEAPLQETRCVYLASFIACRPT